MLLRSQSISYFNVKGTYLAQELPKRQPYNHCNIHKIPNGQLKLKY